MTTFGNKFMKMLKMIVLSPVFIIGATFMLLGAFGVTLLVFGFDRDQEQGRLKNLIVRKKEYKGIKIYGIGNIKAINTNSLWNAKVL